MPPTRKIKNNPALTLIELLIVTAILAAISLAIYTTLNNGLRIWQRVNALSSEEDINIFFEKLASDTRSALKYTGINFSGSGYEFEMPALVLSKKMGKKIVGKVRYIYDDSKREIGRHQSDFSDIYTGYDSGIQRVAGAVKSLKFQYYVYDKERKEYLWQDECTSGDLPSAVRVELETTSGDRVNMFTRTTAIPVGN